MEQLKMVPQGLHRLTPAVFLTHHSLLSPSHFILLATPVTPRNCQAFFHLQTLSMLVIPLSSTFFLSSLPSPN